SVSRLATGAHAPAPFEGGAQVAMSRAACELLVSKEDARRVPLGQNAGDSGAKPQSGRGARRETRAADIVARAIEPPGDRGDGLVVLARQPAFEAPCHTAR